MKLKINPIVFFLFGIFVLADNMFWLVDESKVKIGWDIAVLLIVFIFGLAFVKKRESLFSTKRNDMSILMLLPVLIVAYSAVVGYFNYGQSVVRDFLVMRRMYAGFLIYFPVAELVNKNRGYLDKILHLILLIGIIELVIYIPQYFLADRFVYLNCNISKRFGDVRMYASACAIPVLAFYCINEIMYKKGNKFKYWVGIIACLFYSVVVSKTRMEMVAYICAMLVGYLLWKGGGVRKVFMSVVAAAGLIYLTNTELFGYFVSGLRGEDNSSKIRAIGREFYMSKWLDNIGSFIFGNGIANSDFAERVTKIKEDILPVDLGVFAIAFMFGAIGLIWFGWMFIRLLKKSWKLSKSNNVFCVMYIVFLIVLSPTITNYIWMIQYSLVLGLMACYIEKVDCIEDNNKTGEYISEQG